MLKQLESEKDQYLMTKDINYTLLKKEKQSLEDENKKIQNLLYQSYEKIKSLESLQMEN